MRKHHVTTDCYRRITIGDVEPLHVEEEHIAPYVDIQVLNGNPDMVQVTFPPNGRIARHHHPADTIYVFRRGEFHIDGEGVYREGEARWVKGGIEYGPEWAGPSGATLLIIAVGGRFGNEWADQQRQPSQPVA
jgi:quercetin dioxygenase-like cupin family protein